MNVFDQNNKLDITKLTRIPSKSKYFLKDTYFREVAYELSSCFGYDSVEVISKLSLVLVRPDAFVLRKASEAVERITNFGYKAIFFKSVNLSRFMIREIWRESYSQASIERVNVHERLFGLVEAIAIIFYNPSSTTQWPASVELSIRKGSTKQEKRNTVDLRALLGSPSRFLSLIHISDEPADVMRELGILFPSYKERKEIYSRINDLSTNHHAILNEKLKNVCREVEERTQYFRNCKNNKKVGEVDFQGYPIGCTAKELSIPTPDKQYNLEVLDNILKENKCECLAACWVSVVLAAGYISPYDEHAVPSEFEKFTKYWVDKSEKERV